MVKNHGRKRARTGLGGDPSGGREEKNLNKKDRGSFSNESSFTKRMVKVVLSEESARV